MSTYTPSLGLELITPGSQAGLWGNTTNNSLNLIDQAITGVTPVSFAAASGTTYTLTDYNGAQDEARAAVLNVTGTAIGANTIVIPNKQKTYYVRNATGQDIIVKTLVGTTPCTVGSGYNLPVFCDGNNNVFLAILAPGAGTLTVTGGGTGVTTFGTGGFVKSSGGANALTASATVSLTSEVSGTLPVSSGGTGQTSLSPGGLLFGNGTGAVGSFVGGASGQVATWNGSAWVAAAPTASGVTSVNGQTGAVTITTSSIGAYPSSNPSGYITSSALSGYATTSQLSNYMPLSGGTFTGVVTSTAWNMNSNTSIYWSNASSFVGISAAGATFAHYSNGNATAPGTWQSLSDARLKENVTTLGDVLNKVTQLRPVEFSMKADKSSVANRYGLIAQELETVFPNTVSNTDTDYDGVVDVKSVSYTELVPVLIKAIQELKAEVDALKAAK